MSFFWNLSFAGAALAYGLLSAMLLVRGSRNPLNGSFAAAAAATSLWAAVELAHPAPWNEALFTALRDGAPMAAAAIGGRRGHPVGFAATYADALMALDGDRGARDVVAAAGSALCEVEVDDDGTVRDIDVPADLAR